MNFINFTNRPLLASSIFVVSLGSATQQVSASDVSVEKRANVIFIMTDQQTASAMSCVGNPHVSTPAMDALAADGVLFQRAYCPYPLSGPARASIMTGRMPFEVGATDNEIHPHAEDMAAGIGHVMTGAGYETLYAGKWHIPQIHIPADQGFKKIANINDLTLVDSCRVHLTKEYDKPIFLVASFLNPHEICEYARNQTMPYGPLDEPFTTDDCPNLPYNFMPSTYEAEAIRLSYKSAPRIYPSHSYSQDEWRHYLYTYYRLVERVDLQLGKLIELLKETGLYDSSVIIFTSDHGDGVAAHQWNQKWVLFEEVINVPLIVKAPKGEGLEGVVNESALSNIGLDIYKTICDYANVPLDEERYRGVSYRDVVEGRSEELHEEVFVETLLEGIETRGWAIIEDKYKYVHYNFFKNKDQLYDLESDRGEMLNLAVDKDYDEVVKRMRKKMYEWALKTNDPRLIRNLKPLVVDVKKQ